MLTIRLFYILWQGIFLDFAMLEMLESGQIIIVKNEKQAKIVFFYLLAMERKKSMRRRFIQIGLLLTMTLTIVSSAAASSEKLIPGGNTVGLQLQTDGVVVAEVMPECQAALKKGDYIVAIDNQAVKTADEIQNLLAETDQNDVAIRVVRGGKPMQFLAELVADGKLGVYVRDSLAGIGTVTYFDPQTGDFGALGHGVSDQQTLELLNTSGGTVLPAQILSVKKGKAGAPGQLQGAASSLEPIGTIEKNTDHGVFGTMDNVYNGKDPVDVVPNAQIEPGHATILSNISGTNVQEYDVEILRLYPTEKASGRNLLLQVTDPELLQATGGIVQGMSGSPILQNGKIVGAVTHVLVDDPTMGYGIFIENMLDAAG